MRKLAKVLLVTCMVICMLMVACYYYLSTNINFLMAVAGVTDVPSHLHSWVMKRIYVQCLDPSIRRGLLDDFVYERRKSLTTIYIDIFGVIGDVDAVGPIVEVLARSGNEKQYITFIHSVDSLGLIGDNGPELLLRSYCDKFSDYRLDIPSYSLSRAIYMISGDSYNCKESDIKHFGFVVTDVLIYARGIVVSSRGRYRTLEEMMALENYLRPPKLP